MENKTPLTDAEVSSLLNEYPIPKESSDWSIAYTKLSRLARQLETSLQLFQQKVQELERSLQWSKDACQQNLTKNHKMREALEKLVDYVKECLKAYEFERDLKDDSSCNNTEIFEAQEALELYEQALSSQPSTSATEIGEKE